MNISHIPFEKTGYFSPLICDYLKKKPELSPLYNNFPELENFKIQVEEKKKTFNSSSRSVLVSALEMQYASTDTSDLTRSNIESLKEENTFTITTGHQLNLFTGP